MERELTLPLETEAQLIAVRNAVRQLAADAKMSLVNQTKLMTAASELGRNALRYAHGGQVTIALRQKLGRPGIELVFTDQGPGIANLAEAMQDGFSTGKGLGLGLPGTQRLMDEFHIESSPGEGTTVTIAQW